MSGRATRERRVSVDRRRATSQDELTRLRALERLVRDFALYVGDNPRNMFAPRTLAMVDESRNIFGELDRLRGDGELQAATQ